MKHTGGWARKVALRTKTPLVGSTPMQRASRLTRTAALKVKRPKVSPEERAARKTVKARAQGRCEGCNGPGPTDYSHRVNQGQGGPWVASNAMALDRRCHGWLHDNLLAARELGWYLRSYEDYRAIPVQHAWLGFVLLHDDGSTTRYEEKRAS